MIDEQLISRLYTRPYNPVSNEIDHICNEIRYYLKYGYNQITIRMMTGYNNPSMLEDTFYLCYQAAVMSI